ncbi:UDP-N-acetylmuramoyl-tripeptide--D-alanyl-D-alanine ligase [Roseomonas mucosa]|uniref:UDP-N-acetylmuramoyl-tripeptide--D-alanyl-D-alanine ligase n=2 Tax=Roseomonas mucosa TaxID=207340 RepID=A0A379MV17_9PROT|nr:MULTISPECIES: UDP-N-acetylmuramoyl-tripeptide--D-alanyl-D-alanine ligase [Roseomonas]MBS5902441.1 UDP-N-acetylmuramoyl-tripeptide--D-alanyl-D-alanine ligase [Acetobacteraceae bacterium]MCG7352972.1 UDP-N-acetylmuramoyl-tripeptide--D-alanyl-D-alanine ligase [Roseomonas mucosa]MCG7357280.1 UDP-N-acetylmuramoyl-tripeptide--D-alanyl-D-alanine ligase [Roseomonas mucosa]MDT8289878.1 UDP-N-acetylmuramoyl-tripeptide--D-alanyl-D-alanine ligase [Roseomonas mucosa]MDT8294772.1 UDP-N-acetylmuramoyl-tri
MTGTPLWSSEELREATGGSIPEGIAATGLSIDTRSLQPGDLFIALRDQRDGHDFVAAALDSGAAAAMVDRLPPEVPEQAPLLRVADTLAGLAALGAAARARSTARFAAVTGSVGKTTTKEMLRQGLAALAPTHAAVASYNNHWGVPLTLARQPRDAAYAVIEIGMNNRGEIAPLARLARPEVAVITIIAAAHVGHLGSEAEIAEEKADILAGIAPGGTAVFPADGPHAARLAERAREAGARLVSFGEAERADIRLLDWQGTATGSIAHLSLHGMRLGLKLPVPGRHMALNALAALGAAEALGADPVRFLAALEGFSPTAGRGQRQAIPLEEGGEFLLLDESYNANTASVAAALAVLAAQPTPPPGRRIAVLGDMLELGEHGPDLHRSLAPAAAAAADLVYCCGPLMRGLFEALPPGKRGAHAPDSASLAPVLASAVRGGDAVMVKGSLGSRMATVVAALKGRRKEVPA